MHMRPHCIQETNTELHETLLK
eukprot:COSAG02_NODE_53021_length_304_cov_0.756098_1_plen_21_part_01